MTQDGLVGNTIEHHPELGYFLNVYDYRPETLGFMEENELQGGGPTWMGLINAALELESPGTAGEVDFDDEADVVLVTSDSEAALRVIQSYVSMLMSDRAFMERCISKGRERGYLE